MAAAVAVLAAGVGMWVMGGDAVTGALGLGKRTARSEKRPFSPYEIDRNPRNLPDPIEVLRERFNVTVLSKDPLVYQFENFLTDKECKAMKMLGTKAGLARSTAGLSRTVDNVRTSSTAWLTSPELAYHRQVQAIERRMGEAMNIPPVNMEHFQVLNYQVGQFYKAHHDYIPEHQTEPCGPRLATFFVYLNDVDEGGGTDFPKLGFTAWPKKGRAVLWYNTWYNNNTEDFTQEHRTMHEAMPVVKGEKWAANKWIHTGDFVTNWQTGNSL